MKDYASEREKRERERREEGRDDENGKRWKYEKIGEI